MGASTLDHVPYLIFDHKYTPIEETPIPNQARHRF